MHTTATHIVAVNCVHTEQDNTWTIFWSTSIVIRIDTANWQRILFSMKNFKPVQKFVHTLFFVTVIISLRKNFAMTYSVGPFCNRRAFIYWFLRSSWLLECCSQSFTGLFNIVRNTLIHIFIGPVITYVEENHYIESQIFSLRPWRL